MNLPFAYMNPGAGSFLLQLLLMGTAGVFLAWKSVWNTLRSLWRRKK